MSRQQQRVSRGKREDGRGNGEGQRRGNGKEEHYKMEKTMLEGAGANSPEELLPQPALMAPATFPVLKGPS